jgi:hypothetical protein
MRVGPKYITSPRTLLSLTSPPARAPQCRRSYFSPSLCEPNPLSSAFTQPTHIAQRACRTCELLDRAREPRAGANGPEPQGVGKDNPDCYGCIVERLRADRVELWEAKRDRDKDNPKHGGDRDWVRELAEMEWSSHESICMYDAQGDRNSYESDKIICGSEKVKRESRNCVP